MPSGDLRKQILIEMRSDSQGVAARAAEEVQKLKNEIALLTMEFATFGGDADDFKQGITGLTSEFKFWEGTLKSATAAMAEADDQNARYLARLKEMAAGQNAYATALELTTANVRTSSQAVVDVIQATQRQAEEEKKAEAARIKAAATTETLQQKMTAYFIKKNSEADEAATRQEKAASRESLAWQRASQEVVNAENKRLETVEKNYVKTTAATDAANLSLANSVLKGMTFTQQATTADQRRAEVLAEESRITLYYASSTDSLTAKLANYNAAQKLAASGHQQGEMAAQRFGYAMLNLSHGLQDLQYGFGAFLNNIPLIVQNLGGRAGFAGAAMLAGTAANVAAPSFKELMTYVGLTADALDMASGSASETKKKLDALTAKTHKLTIDYSEIETAKLKLKELEENEAAYESNKKGREGEFMEAEGKAATDVVSTKRIADAARTADIMSGVDRADEMTKRAIEQDAAIVERLQKRVDESSGVTKLIAAGLLAKHQEMLAKLEEDARTQQEEYYKNLAGGFAKGKLPQIGEVRQLAEKPGTFTKEELTAIMKVPYTPEMIKELTKQFSPEAQRKDRMDVEEQKKMFHVQQEKDREAKATRTAQVAEEEAARNKAVVDLVGGMSKPLGGEFVEKANAMAGRGRGREQIEESLATEIANRLIKQGADKKIAPDAARKLATGFAGKAFGAIAGQGDVTAEQGAMAIDAVNVEKEGAKIGKGLRKNQAEMKRGASRIEQGQIAGAMMQDFGMTGEQAAFAAPRVQKKMQQGVPGGAAAQSVVAEMQKFIQNQNMAMLQLQATQEQLGGMFGVASQQLQMFRQQQAMVRQQMRQNTRPSFMQPFAQR